MAWPRPRPSEMELILQAIGLVLLVEGLVYALAPHLVEDLLKALRDMPIEMRRTVGLGAMALGAAFLWLASSLGAFG